MTEQLRPGSAAELKDLVAWAAGEESALEILGAGSKRAFGRPVAAAHAVSLEGLAGIGLYEPEELVMSAACGTPLAEVEARLAENRQQLAFEPADYGPLLGGAAGRGTIGGAFACNLSGPRRIKAGAARDHLLGVQAVTGRGDLIKSGGRVVKNVTGYDLCKLLTGSFGTLAVMTEVTFKVLPAAPESCTLLLAGRPRDQAMAALREALGSANDVAGAACLPAAAAARSGVAEVAAAGDLAAVRLEGLAPSVDYRAGALETLLAPTGGRISRLGSAASATLWREIRDVRLLPTEAAAVWRVSTPPSVAPALLATLERALPLSWFADWGGGLLWLALAEAGADAGAAAIRGALENAGGHATLVRGSQDLRAAIAVFQPQPAPLARLTARVKDSFDPKRVLNPGRMYADV